MTAGEDRRREHQEPAATVGFGYLPPTADDRYDELIGRDGAVRSSWRAVVPALHTLGVDGLAQLHRQARRLMRDNGVIYNTFHDPHDADRSWRLDPIPLTLAAHEWAGVERGLSQRAELLRRLLADLYGPRRLLGRQLPAALILSLPGYLRACHDLPPPAGCGLPLYAADLARDVDGTHYVVADRAQTPPGIGFALENRLTLSRLMPETFRDARVQRLAGYFAALRDTLMRLAWQQRDDTRIVLLTPGPSSDLYFEHVFLANYLGYTLVEGADLTVRDGALWLKTLDGLQRIDVLLRFVADRFCDPLELGPGGGQGVAGLLAAARLRQVAIANPLGVGVIDSPVLARYLPELCRELLGETLRLPSPPSFWCGIAAERDHVLTHLGRLRIYHLSGRGVGIHGAQLDRKRLERLRAAIRARPEQYAAREIVRASTVPTFGDDGVRPRPLLLRSFLVSSDRDGGYLALPGGLVRIAADADAPVPPVQTGGVSKDVWVLSEQPVRPLTLLGGAGPAAQFAIRQGELPSRAAENLYWFGRYAERSESVIRLLREVFLYRLKPDQDDDDDDQETCFEPLLRAVTELTQTRPGFVGRGGKRRLARPDAELRSVFLDPARAGSLAATLRALLFAASAVRDRLSPDLWRVLSDVDQGLAALRQPRGELRFRGRGDSGALNAALDELNRLLVTFAAFGGLATDSMTHGQGWRLMMIGRRLERALQSAALLRAMFAKDVPAGRPRLLESLLRVGDSLMTYRSRYRSQLRPAPVLELLLQDETNPRAVGYQLRHLRRDAVALPGVSALFPYQKDVQSIALRTLTAVRLADPPALLADRAALAALLDELCERLPVLSDALSAGYFSHAEERQLGAGELD